ncbi:MAG: 16S rRNA processing protein RimM [Chloroflexi bacterium]|nr:16S rRNA processing protein RimM [Chloroflexota bacterium]
MPPATPAKRPKRSATKAKPQEFVQVGRILRPWGLQGMMRIEQQSDNPERFKPGARLYIGGEPYTVERNRLRFDKRLIKVEGIDTPEDARTLAGAIIEVPLDEMPEPPEGRYYHYHLLGMKVVTTQGEALGEIVEIMPTRANTVFIVKGPRGEVLIPSIADVVKQVDIKSGVMTIEVLPGLL